MNSVRQVDSEPPRLAQAAAKEFVPGAQPHGPSYVVFSIAGRRFAVQARLCKGVFRQPVVTRLPGVPRWFLGVVALRGEIVSLTDPACLLNLRRDPGSAPPGYAVLLARGDAKVGLSVDRVVDVMPLPELEEATGAFWEGCPRGLLTGQVPEPSAPVLVLDGCRYVEVTGAGGPPTLPPWPDEGDA